MRSAIARPPKTLRVVALAALALALLAAPASAAGLGPDAGQSPNADAIRTSYWVMLVVTALLGFAIIAGLLLAVRKFRARDDAPPRRLVAGRGVMGKAAAGLGVLAAAIFVFGVVMTGDARNASADDSSESVDINVVGQQWMWRYEYPRDPESSASEGIATTFSYNELVIPVDATVNLTFESTDVIHRWFVPELGGQVEAVPGESAEMTIRAAAEGTYRGQSTEFSGTAFPAMRTVVRVVSTDEYEQYIEDLSADISDALDEVQSQVADQMAEDAAATGEAGEAGEEGASPEEGEANGQ